MSTSKLEFFGILAAEPDIELKPLVQRLKIPYNKLMKWKKEHQQYTSADDVAKAVNADQIIVDRIATEVSKEILEATPEELTIDPKTNKIVAVSELQKYEDTKRKAIEDMETLTKSFKDRVNGLQALQSEMQATAGALVNKIAGTLLDEEGSLAIKDLASLSSALSTLHNAFFNRPSTNIQVNQITGDSSLDEFRSNLRN